MSSYPTFRLLNASSSNFEVVEVCPRAKVRYLVWLKSGEFTPEWQEKMKTAILKEENTPKSPLVIPVTEERDYMSDRYESDSEDEKVDDDAEFDSQWMPKVDLTPYKPTNNWIKVDYKKRISAVKIAENEIINN
jgi:hypothetical protein